MDKNQKQIIANNKKAYHDYFVLETYEAGIELFGTEIKSIETAKLILKIAFVRLMTVKCLLSVCIFPLMSREIALIVTQCVKKTSSS